jgi:hypothetical protein
MKPAKNVWPVSTTLVMGLFPDLQCVSPVLLIVAKIFVKSFLFLASLLFLAFILLLDSLLFLPSLLLLAFLLLLTSLLLLDSLLRQRPCYREIHEPIKQR